jgi:DNA topoisomerase-1
MAIIEDIQRDGGLMIVESPTKAREITGFLGSGWKIMATKGFMFELKDPKKSTSQERERYGDYSIDVRSGRYERLLDHDPQNRKQWGEIRSEVRSGRWKHFYVSTDPDEAGELIGYEVVQSLESDLKKSGMDVRRASWHEITKRAVLAGLESYASIDVRKAESAEARQVYDRLFGFSISPYLWKTVGSGTSGGRAQSPTLRLVVNREKDRLGFVKASYGSIEAVFNRGTEAELTASLVEYDGSRIASGSDYGPDGMLKDGSSDKLTLSDDNVKKILKDLKSKKYSITDITEKPYKRNPPTPYTTSSYQQNVGSMLGLTASRAMSIAQQLFEHTYQTYSRTDSPAMADEAVRAARSIIRKQYGGQMPSKPIIYKSKSKNAQEGHECIRPVVEESTGIFYDPAKIRGLTASSSYDAKAGEVYDLVYRRTVASQMNPARGITRKITITSSDGKAVFTTSSTRIDDRGFLSVYDDGEE